LFVLSLDKAVSVISLYVLSISYSKINFPIICKAFLVLLYLFLPERNKDTFFHMCTERKAAVSEHRNRNPKITSPMRYHCINFVAMIVSCFSIFILFPRESNSMALSIGRFHSHWVINRFQYFWMIFCLLS